MLSRYTKKYIHYDFIYIKILKQAKQIDGEYGQNGITLRDYWLEEEKIKVFVVLSNILVFWPLK